MRRKTIVGVFLAILTCLPPLPRPAVAQSPTPQQILMLGNSLTRGIGRRLVRLFRDNGLAVRIESLAPSGFRLSDHALRARTARKLASRAWDIVIMQEQSDGIYDARYPAARALDGLAVANGASTMFFMTWRQRGAPPSAYDKLKGEPGGSFGYVPIAFELDVPVAPVGWAFRSAVAADPNVDLWQDAVHANNSGRYLAACVLYAAILRQSPVGNGYRPGSLEPFEALALQQLAHDTVLIDPGQWNIPPP
jgi:hypothetical protein